MTWSRSLPWILTYWKIYKVIQKVPAPKDVSQLRSFLGLMDFYGKFVKDLDNLRAPLDTYENDVAYTWTPECQSSFDKIKAILSSENCRHLPVFAESIRAATQVDLLIQLVINYTKKMAQVILLCGTTITAEIP